MIKFRNVTKYYPSRSGRRTIIENLSCDFNLGEDIGILGRNGAGKSTLFRLISGSEPCDEGEIWRNSTVSWPLGFSGGFHGSLSGRENLRFVSRIYGQNARNILDFVVDFSELGSNIDMPVKTYSSGMKARLAFGLSMAIDFDFYLIDEVIAVGDANFKKKCHKIIEEKRKTATIILISHGNGLLREFCKRGAILEAGRLSFFNTIDEAITAHEKNQDSN